MGMLTRTRLALVLTAAGLGALALWIGSRESGEPGEAVAPPQVVVGGRVRSAWPQRDLDTADARERDSSRSATHAAESTQAANSNPAPAWQARFRQSADGTPLAGLAVELRFYARSSRVQPWVGRSDAAGEISVVGIDFEATPAAELLVIPDARTAGLRTQVDLAPQTEPLQFDLPPPFQLRVLAEDRGRAAQGVEVELLSMAAPTTSPRVDAQSTDAAGVAQFAWTYPHEELLVRARSSDLVAVETAVVRAPLSEDTEVRLQLAPAAVVEVCVRGEDGAVKSGACVQLRSQSSLQSASDAAEEANRAAQRQGLELHAQTDASGCVRFDPAPSGCTLFATTGCEGLVLAAAEAAPLEVAEVRRIELRLAPSEGLLVQVEDGRGRPLRGASVGVELEQLGATDEHGQFLVPPSATRGKSLLWAHAAGWSLESICAADLSTTEPGRVLRLELAREEAISGEVSNASGRAAPHVTIRALPSLGPECAHFAMALATLASQRSAREGEATERTDASGKFRVSALGPGVYDLHVKPPKGPGFVVTGIRAGVDDLRITLPDADARSGPRFDVTVVDAVTRAPLRGASAVAWILDPGQDERTQRKSSHDQEARTTDKAGRASLRLPAPGWFALSASMDGYVSPAEMEYRWFDAGTHAVEVELQPASALDVFVIDAAAKPVAGALIQVRGAGGAPLSLRFARGEFTTHDVVCPTDSRGSAPRQKLPPGEVTVVLLSPDRSTVLAEQRASLAPGGELRVELRAP